ncbi:NYN domain-containing protein [Alkalihalobacillus sp. LMS39]|uniref:NYN domain-containing protein n=1 Tax=Alkalihalobacillus sp. LMS39 TaxID=2924032 RepID=UPI001FB48BAB|nr:NYN domain-containing protein [Alkalihalobacillus sp. LMS39]UOE94234.1 NYN domain-containing protein [Alkalihalobacillus sp. LMS39]
MNVILLVDGYNIIGAWPELRELKNKNLALARDLLIEKMAEYQAYTGYRVIVVFDAHMVSGIGKKYNNYRVDIVYTRENETADERIEKLVMELKRIDTQIYVATSDFVEQSVTFGKGALRKSARELIIELDGAEKSIKKNVEKTQKKQPSTKIPLSSEIAEIFERWRRGDR